MTLRDVLKVIRPASKVKIKKSMTDQGVVCMRYEALDESGLVDPVIDRSMLDREVVVMHPTDDKAILIRVR